MNELLPLFPVLFLVYVLQCIGSAPSTSEVFVLSPRLRGRKLRGTFRFGRSGNQLFLMNPFLPSVGALLVEAPPFVARFDPHGAILGFEPRASELVSHPQQFCSFESPHQFRAEQAKVLVDGQTFLTTRTDEMAQDFAAFFGKVQAESPKRRSELVGKRFRKLFSLEEIDQRLEAYSRSTELLHIACSYLFLFIFLCTPPLIFFRGLHSTWPLLLSYLVIASAFIVWLYCRALRALYSSRQGQNLPHLIGIALSPFAAIRANDSLVADLLNGYHPVAVAFRIFPEKEFREFAERELRKAKYLLSDQLVLELLSEFLRKQKLDVDSLLSPPLPESPRARSFCPVCLTQYVIEAGICPDCGQIALQPLPECREKRGEAAKNF